MEKGNKIYLIISIICAVLVIAFCAFAIYKHSNEEQTDGEKFKIEYEALNDEEVGRDDKKYPIVSIDADNPIVYVTPKESVEIMKKEDAIVYFGFATCPWCRNIIETLIEVAKEKNVEKIYYVDIKDIRDTYEFSGSIKPEQTKKGTEAYYEILKFFGKKLDKYTVKDEEGNTYDTGVTRLYAPTVVSVSKGKVKDMHVSTVESHTDPYVKINDEQKEELHNELVELIEAIKPDTCSDDAC